MKKVSRIEYCASFEPLQSGMGQDGESKILFPTMKTLGGSDAPKKAEKAAPEAAVKAPEPIDFSKVKIKDCVAVPKSKKLLQFTLDDGSGTDRTILSGIHEYYEPEELIGKTAIAIVNLPPRKMMGIDSCGMLISAVHEEDGKEGLNLLMVDDRIPAGAKLY